MANDLDLKIRISAELKELRSAIQAAQGDLKRFSDQANKAGNAADGINKLDARLSGMAGTLKGLVGGFATLATLKAFIDMADQAKMLNARLQLVTSSTEELKIAQAGLFEIAQNTRTDLGQTVELYTKLATATKEYGASQGTLLRSTELIGKAVQLSGVSAESANAAIVQLSQGLASGTLRGEELNSVLEQTPRLAQAIAQGMGIGVGQLRQMGQEGKITADQVINALLKQGDALDAEFKKLPLTVSGSMTQLKNSVQGLVGQFDAAVGSSTGLANAIASVAEMLQDIDLGPVVAEFEQFASVAGVTLEEVSTLLGAFVAGLEEGLGKDGVDAVAVLEDAFKNLPANVRAFVQLIVIEIASIKDKFLAYAQGMKDGYAAIFTDDTIAAAEKRMNDRLKAIAEARKTSIEDVLKERQAHIDAGKAAEDRFKQERADRTKARLEAEKIIKKPEAIKPKAATGENGPGVVDQAAVLKADVDNQIKELDRLYTAGKIKLEDYFAKKKDLAQQMTDLEVKELEQKLKSADKAAEKSKLLTDIQIARKKGEGVQAEIAAQEKLERDQRVKDAEILQAELAQVEGRAADARRIQVEQKYKEMIERLKLEGDTAGVEIIEKLINTEVSQAKFAELKAQADRVVEELRSRQESLSNQVLTGALDQPTANNLMQEDRQKAIEDLTVLNQKAQELATTTNDPKIVEGANQINAALQRIGTEGATGLGAAIQSLRASLAQMQDQFATSLANAGVDALTNMFTSLADGSKNAKDAIKDFALDFARSMAQIAARALATFLVLTMLDAIYPGLGRMTAAAGGATAGVHHTGGVAGRPRATRNVDPSLFAGAPRYHVGGVAGLKPGEVPAILQTGEEVLSRNDPRNVMNGGGGQQGSGGGVRVLNVIDPNMMQDYLASSGGEQTILNVLQRNGGAVKQILG